MNLTRKADFKVFSCSSQCFTSYLLLKVFSSTHFLLPEHQAHTLTSLSQSTEISKQTSDHTGRGTATTAVLLRVG